MNRTAKGALLVGAVALAATAAYATAAPGQNQQFAAAGNIRPRADVSYCPVPTARASGPN